MKESAQHAGSLCSSQIAEFVIQNKEKHTVSMQQSPGNIAAIYSSSLDLRVRKGIYTYNIIIYIYNICKNIYIYIHG